MLSDDNSSTRNPLQRRNTLEAAGTWFVMLGADSEALAAQLKQALSDRDFWQDSSLRLASRLGTRTKEFVIIEIQAPCTVANDQPGLEAVLTMIDALGKSIARLRRGRRLCRRRKLAAQLTAIAGPALGPLDSGSYCEGGSGSGPSSGVGSAARDTSQCSRAALISPRVGRGHCSATAVPTPARSLSPSSGAGSEVRAQSARASLISPRVGPFSEVAALWEHWWKYEAADERDINGFLVLQDAYNSALARLSTREFISWQRALDQLSPAPGQGSAEAASIVAEEFLDAPSSTSSENSSA